jgi:adenylosuccinate lyase
MPKSLKIEKGTLDFEIPKEAVTRREGTGISNLDGRLWDEMGYDVGRFFGDEAMVRARVGIEARYLISLSEIGVIRKITFQERQTLLSLHNKVDAKAYIRLREIESEVRHDVLSMTQLFKELSGSFKDILDHGWLHWGLASEDVDNISKSILTTNFFNKVYFPQASLYLDAIYDIAKKTKDVVIPGKTHIQTAIPTTLGKELALFGVRFSEVFNNLKSLKLRAKLTGAVGNLSAHKLTYPEKDWRKFSKNFIESLGLEANLFTTQIEPRNRFVEILDAIETANFITIDLSQDTRLYIGFEWLSQLAKSTEFGSSAMPQKVNPIDFENAQGNAKLSNWIIAGLKENLLVSWLQRDLTDKTVLRNLGLIFGYSLISMISSVKGLQRISPNREKIKNDLNSDWSLIAEAYQITLRAHGMGDAYELLKKLTRGRKVTQKDIEEWIENLKTTEKIRGDLRKISPQNYIGYAKENCDEMLKNIRKAAKSLV